MQVLNSQITSVTVFPDQATVTRIGELSLTAGETTRVFDEAIRVENSSKQHIYKDEANAALNYRASSLLANLGFHF